MRHCMRRGNVNLDGVASSKRPLFWMIVAIAAARSVLHERAAFVTSWGSSERTPFCSFVFVVLGLCVLQQSFYVKSMKDGTFRFHDLSGVFISLPIGVILYRFQHYTKLGGWSKRCRCSPLLVL